MTSCRLSLGSAPAAGPVPPRRVGTPLPLGAFATSYPRFEARPMKESIH
jgi:hypothetical protein